MYIVYIYIYIYIYIYYNGTIPYEYMYCIFQNMIRDNTIKFSTEGKSLNAPNIRLQRNNCSKRRWGIIWTCLVKYVSLLQAVRPNEQGTRQAQQEKLKAAIAKAK